MEPLDSVSLRAARLLAFGDAESGFRELTGTRSLVNGGRITRIIRHTLLFDASTCTLIIVGVGDIAGNPVELSVTMLYTGVGP